MSQLAPLVHAWQHLYLAVEAQDRVARWDILLLTASNPAQAALYRAAMDDLQRRGRLPSSTRVEVVEDPQGQRIGSGGATLHALASLADRIGIQALAAARILLIHAGGDGRRLPWASALGKAFIPVPLLADPDHPAPSLIEHILALSAPVPALLQGPGMLCLTGDVLPLASLADIAWPQQGMGVVSCPASIPLATRHGVVIADAQGRIEKLVQKGSPQELADAGGLLPEGGALIDTGIWYYAEDALLALSQLAISEPRPVAALCAAGSSCGLYDDIPLAALGHCGDGLLGQQLRTALQGLPLQSCRMDSLRFLHLGTSAEYLEHMGRSWEGQRATRVHSLAGEGLSDMAICCSSSLDSGCVVGEGSVIAASRLGPDIRIGRRCVVIGVDAPQQALRLPDHHCCWQLPLRDGQAPAWVSLCCGSDDDPKQPMSQGRFCGQAWEQWLAEHQLTADAIWPQTQDRCLWTARLFPLLPGRSLAAVAWLIRPQDHQAGAAQWQAAEHYSLADCAQHLDSQALISATQEHADHLALAIIGSSLRHGHNRDIAALASGLSPQARVALPSLADHLPDHMPKHRWARMRYDLLRHSHPALPEASAQAQASTWQAVAEALRESLPAVSSQAAPALSGAGSVRLRLPARFDLAGGWSDTPPYCLENPAQVLNLAVEMADGRLPLGAQASLSEQAGLHLRLDAGPWQQRAWSTIVPDQAPSLADPFALLQSACVVCGFHSQSPFAQATVGLRLHAWSELPRGSGLGGSSILAAAIVGCLLRLRRGATACPEAVSDPDEIHSIARHVLLVEQFLGTGGGWQDQYGGLVPGVKGLSSLPHRPLSIQVNRLPLPERVAQALRQRLCLVDSGITRLARDVLQRVMGNYLSRSHRVVRGIARLADLALFAHDHLAAGDLEALGGCLDETWAIHQQLDPHCSNPAVDQLLSRLRPHASGIKLAGAGGGGFIGILARDPEQAALIRAQMPGCQMWMQLPENTLPT